MTPTQAPSLPKPRGRQVRTTSVRDHSFVALIAIRQPARHTHAEMWEAWSEPYLSDLADEQGR